MGVYIKSMAMPKGCAFCRIGKRNGKKMVCPLRNEEWDIRDPMSADHRLDNCPLVPVPPHGDLIDRDALIKGEGRYLISFGKEGIDVAEINRAPTIIPAESCDNLSMPCKEDEP